MSILKQHIVFYGSASMPDDDTPTGIGGAIDVSVRVAFDDMASTGNVQVVSSAAGDTTQTVTTYGRDAAGNLISEVKTLTGVTAVPMTVATSWERLLKGVKSATTTGDVAIEAVTATRDDTAQAGADETASAMASITLDASASASDDAYNGQVLRLNGGTGSGQIRHIIDYVGATKLAYVNRDWDTTPDATSEFLVSDGMVFDKTPNEVLEIRRPFYDALAEESGGSARAYYEKVFAENTHATLALTNAVISETADPSTNVDFALESSLDGSDNNGAGARQTHTGGYTFNSTAKNVVNGQSHTAGAGQGIWLRLSLAAGEPANNTSFTMQEAGSST